MNLESVTGSDGRTLARPAPAVPDGPAKVRPGRVGTSGREAAMARPDSTASSAKEPVSRADLERLVDDANADLGRLNEKLGFRVDDGTGQIVVQIVDRGSGEVVRQSPPQEFLDLAARMKEMVGLFLDEQG
jgi:flagellar protein FlaG